MLLLGLALDAMAGIRNGGESAAIDRFTALGAVAEALLLDSLEGLFDFVEDLLGVGDKPERKFPIVRIGGSVRHMQGVARKVPGGIPLGLV